MVYSAFVDPSGGSADSFTLAIGHREDDTVVVDAVRERKPPFSPESVVDEYAKLLERYVVNEVVGDRYNPRKECARSSMNISQRLVACCAGHVDDQRQGSASQIA